MTDFETWLADYGYERIFRMLEYRKPGQFTPYEMEKKFLDESAQYLDCHYRKIMIKEVIELPDKDIMIGYISVETEEDLLDQKPVIYYKKLSEIELTYFPSDEEIDDY